MRITNIDERHFYEIEIEAKNDRSLSELKRQFNSSLYQRLALSKDKNGGYILTRIKVKYVGKDMAEIRNGEIYDAIELKDDSRMYGVVDRSGESYCYPKQLFEVVKE